jgi:excisionase family DNA binding protein
MGTKQKSARAVPGGVKPYRLYTYEELAEVTGLSARRIRRMVEEGRLGHVPVGEERGRVIEGRQYLEWLEARRVDVEG